jgi:hypothetical protein
VMQPAVRQYYALEELWSDGKFDDVVNSSTPVAAKRTRKASAPSARSKPRAPGEKSRRRPAA